MSEFAEDIHYSVLYATKCRIGEEWSGVWDKTHEQMACHRLYYLTEGEGSIDIFDKHIPLLPGRVYFAPAYSIHRSETLREIEKYYIHFQTDSFLPELYRYFDGSFSVPAAPQTEALFRAVTENYEATTMSARMKVQGAMLQLTADFFAGFSSSAALTRFGRVLAYMHAHYAEPLTLAELGRQMHVSAAYFANSFKAAFNISPKQYLLNRRLTESRRLLLETEMSVKEIAYAVGFENANYFSEYFSRRFGISAGEYRRHAQANRQNLM